MNRCALVLTACLAWPTFGALAQNTLKNSALEISVRFDDEPRVDQRIRTVEGGRALILTGPSRPAQKRQYIQTPAGVIAQEVTVVQEQTPSFEVVPRVLGDTVHVQAAGTAAQGRLGEWLRLGAVAAGGATRTVWIKVDEIP
jgi:hypothetical protein